MKNLYNISGGQLCVVWITGIVLALVVQNCGYNTACGPVENSISVLIIAGLFFYTIGWRKKRQEKKGDNK
jgi:uncharacterized membrane protein